MLQDTVESIWDSSHSKFHNMREKIYQEFTVSSHKLPIHEDFSTQVRENGVWV